MSNFSGFWKDFCNKMKRIQVFNQLHNNRPTTESLKWR
ncbi:hypothetical protein FOYG_12692 [Fusarium oxysporum NRRL 32931]|uniref:Uncharacterized protein n=1 Tax=Fusarium oxysporum NRRL 32931 TaxID=660029 RepID=W9HTB2_FUSOX|nr:hypothetical protein FOYG_12692 [Fusarium oxysporum NRRL 32931]